MHYQKSHNRSTTRAGTTLAEVLVALSILLTLFTVSTVAVVRIARIWRQTSHHELAMDELSNQMERLLATPEDEVTAAIENLKISDSVGRSLPNTTLSAKRIQDDLGERIVMSMNWEQPASQPTLQLVAWINAIPASAPNELENNQ